LFSLSVLEETKILKEFLPAQPGDHMTISNEVARYHIWSSYTSQTAKLMIFKRNTAMHVYSGVTHESATVTSV